MHAGARAGPDCGQNFDGCASYPCGANNQAACLELTPAQQAATGLAFSCSSCAPGFYTQQCIGELGLSRIETNLYL